MAIQVLVHITGEAPFVMELAAIPDPKDQIIIGSNPRQRDGKEVPNILPEVNQIVIPWWRVTFLEILPGKEEEEVYGFYRD